jgi:hypothetical protein
VVCGGGSVVGTAATRDLHRSSMSKVNWEGKGPSPPLGGAIVVHMVNSWLCHMCTGVVFMCEVNICASMAEIVPLWQKSSV